MKMPFWAKMRQPCSCSSSRRQLTENNRVVANTPPLQSFTRIAHQLNVFLHEKHVDNCVLFLLVSAVIHMINVPSFDADGIQISSRTIFNVGL